jgi:AbrB family looped-hinge helix DNA binding protein
MTVVKVLRHGQITLPKSLREVLDIKEGDILEIELEESCLVLRTKMLVDKTAALGDAGKTLLPLYRSGGSEASTAGNAAVRSGRGPHD